MNHPPSTIHHPPSTIHHPPSTIHHFTLSLQNKPITLDKQLVTYKDLGIIDYKTAWDYQENLLQQNIKVKSAITKVAQPAHEKELIEPAEKNHSIDFRAIQASEHSPTSALTHAVANNELTTRHYFILCEHPPVYTLGKSGHQKNILISEEDMLQKGIQFYKTNRGGDITFHGPQQIVGYPIIDLEKFYTDIGRYLRDLEQVIILTLAGYGITGERSKGETGVWIQPNDPGKERKICAMGVRCSRWVTMHGFALNVNNDLGYFDNIIPCGIENKKVTSIAKELNTEVDFEEVKQRLKRNFESVFNVQLID